MASAAPRCMQSCFGGAGLHRFPVCRRRLRAARSKWRRQRV